MRRILATVVTLVLAAGITATATGQATATTTHPGITRSAPVTKPGTVRTSANRVAKIDKRGCLFLTYAEAGDPSASDDPTDGIVLCEK